MTTAAASARAEALEYAAAQLAAGVDVSARDLAARFQRSARWGRDVLSAARKSVATREASPVAEVTAETALPEVAAVTSASHPGARLVAWVGFMFGTVISVAANVLAAWIPPEGAAAGWQPGIAPQVGAAVWPLALLLSVEVLSRVRWPTGFGWAAARLGGVAAVALGAAVISYGHIHAVLSHWRYDAAGAYMGPAVVDGLMVISGFALLALSGREAVTADPERQRTSRK